MTTDLRRYVAVIRTHACTPLLEQVVAALKAQTWAPTRVVFVDSSGNPAVREQLLRMGEVVTYPRRSSTIRWRSMWAWQRWMSRMPC